MDKSTEHDEYEKQLGGPLQSQKYHTVIPRPRGPQAKCGFLISLSRRGGVGGLLLDGLFFSFVFLCFLAYKRREKEVGEGGKSK